MDTATTVAIIGLGGTIIGGVVTVIVAIITNRKEKHQAAETAMERTLRERITLRDEQIEDLKLDLQRAEADRDRYKACIDEMRSEEKVHSNERDRRADRHRIRRPE